MGKKGGAFQPLATLPKVFEATRNLKLQSSGHGWEHRGNQDSVNPTQGGELEAFPLPRGIELFDPPMLCMKELDGRFWLKRWQIGGWGKCRSLGGLARRGDMNIEALTGSEKWGCGVL